MLFRVLRVKELCTLRCFHFSSTGFFDCETLRPSFFSSGKVYTLGVHRGKNEQTRHYKSLMKHSGQGVTHTRDQMTYRWSPGTTPKDLLIRTRQWYPYVISLHYDFKTPYFFHRRQVGGKFCGKKKKKIDQGWGQWLTIIFRLAFRYLSLPLNCLSNLHRCNIDRMR